MKRNLVFCFCAFFVGIVLPAVTFSVVEKIYADKHPADLCESFAATDIKGVETEKETASVEQSASDPVVLQTEDGTVKLMDMNTYLTGVLLGELPASFETEALKAQAIVARTYAKKRGLNGSKHPQGAVCMDASCCQAYCPPESYLQSGGKQTTVDSFQDAVKATDGLVLFYEGELIDATYFSCSGGRTEDALAVWGNDVPYLQAVDSPGEENATHYADQIKLSAKDFCARLGIRLSGAPSSWFGKVSYTAGGGVDTMVIGGKNFSGVELRQKLNLYSTAFSVMAVGDSIHIYTRGFGHRVGMSQYGADAMAAAGSDYQKILSHYYPGTIIGSYFD